MLGSALLLTTEAQERTRHRALSPVAVGGSTQGSTGHEGGFRWRLALSGIPLTRWGPIAFGVAATAVRAGMAALAKQVLEQSMIQSYTL